jgi:ketosteroid isomerase-like protein
MRPIIAVASLIVLGCAPEGTTLTALPESEVAAIRQAYQSLTAAGVTPEVRNLGRFFTEDAVLMPADQPAVQGRTAVEAWFTVQAVQWDVTVLEVEGRGDLAFTRSAYTLVLDLPDFTPVTGKGLEVWRKQPDGTWLIARSSFSADSPSN